MGFQLSPGVTTKEIDLTTVVPAVATTEGAIAGLFRWGPVGERTLIDSEATLASTFGKPTNHNAETWFTAANFLGYGNKLYVARAAGVSNNTAVTTSARLTSEVFVPGDANISNLTDYQGTTWTADTVNGVYFAARHQGALGNSLKVSVCDSIDGYTSTCAVSTLEVFEGASNGSLDTLDINITVGSSRSTVVCTLTGASSGITDANADSFLEFFEPGDILTLGSESHKILSIGSKPAAATTMIINIEIASNYLGTDLALATLTRKWEHFSLVNKAPQASTYMTDRGFTAVDGIHIVVSDEDGDITGTPGTILEVWDSLSRASDAKTSNGSINHFRDVIEQSSQYIWAGEDLGQHGSISGTHIAVASALADVEGTNTFSTGQTWSFANGGDGDIESNSTVVGSILTAYDLFSDAADVDISLLIVGHHNTDNTVPNYVINIAATRRDCVAFVSPAREDVVNTTGEAAKIITFRDTLTASSYAVMDSGFKYHYDKYNDVYRYTPLAGDTAGTCARTDEDRDPWWSPAGYNRGQISNVVKLAYNPKKAERDLLYQSDVNPVMTQAGHGTVLFGDKTLLGQPSAFDRINVRRLFIVLEKAIAIAANNFLFEFNDEFTRSRFRNMVDPFLRNIQGRRGITDYAIVADSTNNTGEVIDRNEFVGDIYIKPARSINFITLNFVATRTNVEFSEIIGSV